VIRPTNGEQSDATKYLVISNRSPITVDLWHSVPCGLITGYCLLLRPNRVPSSLRAPEPHASWLLDSGS